MNVKGIIDEIYINNTNINNISSNSSEKLLYGRFGFEYNNGIFEFIDNEDVLGTINKLINYIKSNNNYELYLDNSINTYFYISKDNIDIITITMGFRDVKSSDLLFYNSININKQNFLNQLIIMKNEIILNIDNYDYLN
jgi:hypothetical protein